MPQAICLHNDGDAWEVYDINAAGCRMCGCMHVCCMDSSEGCPAEKNSEGHDICTITGFCIKMLNFSDKEYMGEHMSFSTSQDASFCGRQNDDDENPSCDENDKLVPNDHEDCEDDDCGMRGSRKRKLKKAQTEASQNPAAANKKNRYRSWVHHRIQENAPASSTQKQHDTDKIRMLIDSYVWDILCSSRWSQSMEMEVCCLACCFTCILLQ